MLNDRDRNESRYSGSDHDGDEFDFLNVPPPPTSSHWDDTPRYSPSRRDGLSQYKEEYSEARKREDTAATHHHEGPRTPSLLQLSVSSLLAAALIATIINPLSHNKSAPEPKDGGEPPAGKVEKKGQAPSSQPKPTPKVGSNVSDLISRLDGIRSDKLVELVGDGKLLRVDIPYATDKNFTGSQQYSSSRCFLSASAAKSLLTALAEAERQGYGLHLLDCYRPFSVQEKLYEHQQRFGGPEVASTRRDANGKPVKGSVHNKGGAVDLTLTKNGVDVSMPTEYDAQGEGAHWKNISTSTAEGKNAHRLLAIMKGAGFETVPSEWWHYEWKGGRAFGLKDENFEKITTDVFKVEYR